MADGAGALFYGAFNLPSERAASLSAGTWLGGAQFATAAVSMPLGRGYLAGIGVQSLDYGSVDEIVPDPLTGGTRGTATGGQVGASELALTAGVAQRGRWLRMGISVATVHLQVADLSGSTTAFGMGDGVSIGGWDVDFSLQNGGIRAVTLGASSSTLPLTQRLSARTPSVRLAGGTWVGVAEVRDVKGEGRTTLVGAEGDFVTAAGWRLAARGAVASYSVETARAPWSAGASAGRGGWSLDYAYQGFGPLGAVHRMGVTWRSQGPRNPSR